MTIYKRARYGERSDALITLRPASISLRWPWLIWRWREFDYERAVRVTGPHRLWLYARWDDKGVEFGRGWGPTPECTVEWV